MNVIGIGMSYLISSTYQFVLVQNHSQEASGSAQVVYSSNNKCVQDGGR